MVSEGRGGEKGDGAARLDMSEEHVEVVADVGDLRLEACGTACGAHGPATRVLFGRRREGAVGELSERGPRRCRLLEDSERFLEERSAIERRIAWVGVVAVVVGDGQVDIATTDCGEGVVRLQLHGPDIEPRMRPPELVHRRRDEPRRAREGGDGEAPGDLRTACVHMGLRHVQRVDDPVGLPPPAAGPEL